ncbi:Iron only hydrogenase large subunit, C-terminal domain [Geosporobacter subterraneus DSM 17957]|uniref:Iron only hydrogenase large subunit, C-terminal domain n=1 Tax=Geosporobacter subterraneus DSM 17957 TaxID=1121919 RepID=A0A1M6NQY5_9FIRM|nr:[Fe-Fe] hydrogenase large subunit C-terminal domain-containing protein [Geosporobacter subterraneus]SHJ97982.1 Iron only hydrogenase large subunit, C-terminal domain [Geosporobacter subterraneus DSM 17957]
MERAVNHRIQDYRMMIFGEVVKLAWAGKLKHEADELPEKILKGKHLDERERRIIENHIRISMGLDPLYGIAHHKLGEDVDSAMNQDNIKAPLVSVIEDVCETCQRHWQKERGEEEERCPRDHLDCTEEAHRCIGCGRCIGECPLGAISDKIEFLPVVKLLQEQQAPVYATVAPAYVGQFGEGISPGQIRAALKRLGFTDMVEVAVFADILTVKEAYEFDHMVKTEEDYLITSCCCPVWVGMIQKNYREIAEHISPSVSPMIASGRVLKVLNPTAKVVFIGPCIAKKAEAKIPELEGAIDYVLTFRELKEIFAALEINLETLEEDNREEASFAGRVYGRTGGVSEAVERSVERILKRDVPFHSISFEGTGECKAGLEKLLKGELKANFIEGMGCTGGCVGGPRAVVSIEEGKKAVDAYSQETPMSTPFDNDNVLQLITRLGIKRWEALEDDREESIRGLLGRELKQ